MAPSADSRTCQTEAASSGVQMCATGGEGQDCEARAMDFGLGLRFFLGPRAHFDQQKADSVRQPVEIAQRETFAAHEIDEQIIEAFKTDGLVFEGEGNGIGGEKGIAEAEHREHAEGRAGGEIERGGDDVGAGAFRAHQRAGDVEVVFGQQLVEVVAGDAAGNARKLFAHQGGVAIADARQACVDLADAAAGADERVQLLRAALRPPSSWCRRRERCRAIPRCRRLCRPAGRGRRNCCCR